MTLFYCTTEQVRVSSIFVRVMPLLELRILQNTQFSALSSYMLWHIELKFCIWLCFTVLQIKFQCCQFPSIFVGVMPLLERRILEIHSFPHFSLTRFDILSWNFAYDFFFTLLQIKLSVINILQFLLELCPFWNVENWKYTVFRTLFLHTLTYWAEILHLTFTVLQIKFECRQFPSIFVGVKPLLEPRILEYAIFRIFLLHALIYQAEILHMTFFYCTTDQVPVLSISVNFCWSYAPFGT